MNSLNCTLDGRWGNWSDFTECSVTCGEGNKTQTRLCNNPAPSNGGANCTGLDTNITTCNDKECPTGNTILLISLYKRFYF